MLITGLGVFLVGSLIGTLADDVPTVIAARVVMGAGGALVMPLALAVLPSLFGEPKDRMKAIGIVSAASALGLPLGPILGGWLLDHFWWGSVFLVDIPMVGIGVAACVFLLPEARDPAAPRVDIVSTALTATGLGALIGTGVRMLPMMGGLVVATRAGGPVNARFGARATMSAGLVVLAFAALLGSRTTVDSGYGFTALWLSVAGVGFAVVPAMDAALGALPPDRAGSGSGLLMTVRQTGSALGIALLGSLLAGAYSGRLDTAGVPAAAADTAGDSVVAAHAVAARLGLAAARGLRRRRLPARHEPGHAGHRRHRTGQRPAGRGPHDRPGAEAERTGRRGRHPGRCLTMATMAATSRTPSPAAPGAQPPMGLRERKKLRTRVAIRQATYRLISEQGYDATTIEQIAEAAEVSPSTVFRYFATKEDIVLTDEYDPVMAAALRSRPLDEPPLESLRLMMREALASFMTAEDEELRQRTRLMVEVPAIRARMTETMSDTAKLLSEVVAERAGRSADDLEIRVFIAAVLGALREVTLYWGEHGLEGDIVEMTDTALDTLGGGLRL